MDLEIFVGRSLADKITLSRKSVFAISVDERELLDNGFSVTLRFQNAPHPRNFIQTETRHLALAVEKVELFVSDEASESVSVIRDESFKFVSREPELFIAEQLGLTSSELLSRFESLGHSCDFAFIQQSIGVDQIGLFRFAAVTIPDLTRGILDKFDGIAEPNSLFVYLPEGSTEYWVADTRYGIHGHTFVNVSDSESFKSDIVKSNIVMRERVRLPFLARKLLEDIDDGRKTFLLRYQDCSLSEVLALWVALNADSTNTLMLVRQQTTGLTEPIVKLGTRLYLGFVDGTVGETAPTLESWLRICAQVFWLERP